MNSPINFPAHIVPQVWDLLTQHCVQTCVEHRSEAWAFDVSPDGATLLTGAGDNIVRMWHLSPDGSTAPTATSDAGTVPNMHCGQF